LSRNNIGYFARIQARGRLYTKLFLLESSAPESAKTLEYIGLFNAVRDFNEQLIRINIEAKKTNELLAIIASKNPPN